MTQDPVVVALCDTEAAQRLLGELQAAGRVPELATDADALLKRLEQPVDVVLDPAFAPAGQDPATFVASIASRTRESRLLAMIGAGLSDSALIDLGASEVFDPGTATRLVVRRLGASSMAPPAWLATATEAAVTNVELVADQVGVEDVIDGFTNRVATRMVRARDRERSVAIFCISMRGFEAPNPRRALLRVLETVMEELDRNNQLSCSASRNAIAQVDQDVWAVLIPDVERVQDAARLGVRLHESLAQHTGVTSHVGIACSPDDATTAVDLIERAKDAVLRARREAENHVEFFSDSMSRWAFERLTLEQNLRDAIKNRELVVYYQPRVDIETRRILGMEALVRWIHPSFGLVSPGQFIPLAEETGLIVPIGDWILREACRQNAEWRRKGLPNIRVSVNLSPIQFRKPTLHETVCEALDETGLTADGLELEVTESLLMNDPAETAALLGRFKERGIHISIDDFGTGYSSLSYLKRFPIDALKIDRSFVTEVTSNPDDAAIATAIILMGHSLKLSVVAEGVETENQLAFLKVLQCNEVQGYLFSPAGAGGPSGDDAARGRGRREVRGLTLLARRSASDRRHAGTAQGIASVRCSFRATRDVITR